MFQKTLSFNCRIRRIEYGLSYLMYFVGLGCVSLISTSVESTLLFAIKAILVIPLCWAVLAQGAKRCHDRGNSGWWQLIPFYVLWMLFADSKTGENDYGPNPKGIGNEDWVAEMGNEIQKQSFIS